MLAEIAIANAAFGVIKEAISNGKEIYDVGAQVGQFFDSKTELQKKANKKNAYFLSKKTKISDEKKFF